MALISVILLGYGWKLAAITMPSDSIALGWPVGLFYASVPAGAAFMLFYMLRQKIIEGRGYLPSFIIVALAAIVGYLVFAEGLVEPPEIHPGIMAMVVLFALMALGVPVAFSMAIGALFGYWVGRTGSVPLTGLAHQLANGVDSFILLAIPFFLLAGEFMNAGGILERLFRLCMVLVGHITGGLGHVNVLGNLIMGGMSGSGAADASATSKILIPVMEKAGYSRAYSCAITSASAILANLIPPSIAMMIYASIIWVSVGRLFMAGIGPGIVMALCMMAANHIISKRRGYKGLEKRATLKEVWQETKGAAWALGMPVIILGGLRLGIVTPTEAAGVAAFYALLVGAFVYKKLKWADLPRIFFSAALETAIIMMILGISTPFNWILAAERIPQEAAALMISITNNPMVFLLLINIFLLIVGIPIETFPALIILMPIFGPMLPAMGIDPVHFGLIVIANLLIAPLTPPVGMLVFITSSLAKCSPAQVFKEVMPFMAIMIVGLFIITYVPQISLFLPNLIYGVSK
jgi:C4-dicarboxylate transporter DctM subunit